MPLQAYICALLYYDLFSVDFPFNDFKSKNISPSSWINVDGRLFE